MPRRLSLTSNRFRFQRGNFSMATRMLRAPTATISRSLAHGTTLVKPSSSNFGKRAMLNFSTVTHLDLALGMDLAGPKSPIRQHRVSQTNTRLFQAEEAMGQGGRLLERITQSVLEIRAFLIYLKQPNSNRSISRTRPTLEFRCETETHSLKNLEAIREMTRIFSK